MNKYWELLISYCKDFRLAFLFFAAEISILFGVIVLSDIPDDIGRYLFVLHLFLFFIAFAVSFLKYKQQYQYWKILQQKNHGTQGFGEFSKTNFSCLIGLCEDVIEAQNESIYHQREEAKERLREYQEYYTMWVHQIKTPIFALELLQRGVEDTTLQSRMNAELLKIKDYTQLVLQYIRMEDMAADLEIKRHSLRKILMNVIKKYSILFINQKISLELGDLDIWILTDEKWLSFALSQIITNSLKYTEAGGSIRIDRVENELRIVDTGIGIRAEDIPKLFRKGFTGNNGRLQNEASGMGLYLTAKVLKVLGHDIRLESEPGKGTAVFFELTVKKVEDY